jgi:hypothetical protein
MFATVSILLALGDADSILSLVVLDGSGGGGQPSAGPLGLLLILLVVATLDVFIVFLIQITAFRRVE